VRASAAALALLVAGCGPSNERDAAPAPDPAPPRAAADREGPREALYDPDGALLPSATRIAGLTLPRGMEAMRSSGDEHVFRTEVPMDRIVAYFGPRLFTARVDRVGTGVIYRRARPTEARGSAVYLDVSILPTSEGSTQVHVYELAPPPAPGAGEPTPGFDQLD
jgi:hypothetical protein